MLRAAIAIQPDFSLAMMSLGVTLQAKNQVYFQSLQTSALRTLLGRTSERYNRS